MAHVNNFPLFELQQLIFNAKKMVSKLETVY